MSFSWSFLRPYFYRYVSAVLSFAVFGLLCVAPTLAATDPKLLNTYCIGPFGDCAVYDTECNTSEDTTDGDGAPGKVDINEVVSKYSLQSVMIQRLDGGVVAEHNADEPPVTPASTMKLVIVDTVLRAKIDLDRTVNVTSDIYYDGSNDLGKSRITVREAIQKTLSVSSNVGANVLMKALGGVSDFTSKAQGYDYKGTDVKGYYDPSSRGKNKSTIADQVSAMNHILSSSGAGYEVAENALVSAAKSNNTYNVESDANKWAGTDEVAGNVAKVRVGGKDYIIGVYYNGGSGTSDAKSAMKNGTADLAKVVGGSTPAEATTEPETNNPTGCCPSDGGDAGDEKKDGGGDSGSWNSGLQPPYILEQWAIEVLKNLAKKKGVPEENAVTKDHVVALVAFAIGEGGDIANSYKFNPLNTGINAPELIDGANNASGLQRFRSFDAGIEAAARTFAKPQYSRLATALLKKDSTTKQFMYALSYNWKFPGGAIWAEASKSPGYYEGRLGLVKQVLSNYEGTAGLVIGTEELEQRANKREPSKLQFAGGSTAIDGTVNESCGPAGGGSASAQGIAEEAIRLSWPDKGHGITPTDEYREAWKKHNGAGIVADCGVFVATVMRGSGADKDYPKSFTGAQEAYVRANPDKYQIIEKVDSVDKLKPGDVLIVNKGSGAGGAGHTWIYVGKQPPHGHYSASASLNSRAANLGKENVTDNRGDYLVARLK